MLRSYLPVTTAGLIVAMLAGCASILLTIGPSRWQIDHAKPQPDTAAIQIEEINFEIQGMTLAQALARSGGLIDARSNPREVLYSDSSLKLRLRGHINQLKPLLRIRCPPYLGSILAIRKVSF